MGLDSVELVLRTEDEFSITLSDDEAASATTVGDLYNLVLSKLDVTPGCLSSKAFYFTRRALVESLGLPRRSIRPATPLSPLLPDETRREQWQEIRAHIGLSMPALRIPGAVKQHFYTRSFILSAAIAAIFCVAVLASGLLGVSAIFLSVALWIAMTIAGCSLVDRLFPSLRSELPADTAGELARVVLSLNHDHFLEPVSSARPTKEDVWQRLVEIVCEQLQVTRDEVVPNARFVDDLGVS